MARKQIKQGDNLPPKKISLKGLKRASRLFKFIGDQKYSFFIGLIFLFLTGLTAIIFPKLMGVLVDSGKISLEEINKTGLWLLILFFAQAVFSYFRVVLFVKVTERMLANLRVALYDRLIRMPMHFFAKNRVGEINSRISADISQIQDTFTTNIAEFIRQLIIIIIGIAALFMTSVQLAMVMLAIVPLMAGFAVYFGRYIRKISAKVQDKIAESNTIVEETLQGIMNVKAFANEAFESFRYGKVIQEIRETAVKGGKARGAFYSFIIFCIFGAIVLLVWYAVVLENKGEITHGNVIQFILYTVFVGASIGGIADQYAQIQKALGATERVLDLLDEPMEEIYLNEAFSGNSAIGNINQHHSINGHGISTGLIPIEKKLKGSILFRDVTFAYPSRNEISVLDRINFEASAGQTVALVGPSGSGKSTIVSLLLKLYNPDNGTIEFDGVDSRSFNLTELRNQMAIVPQEVLLFGGTILENIAYGKPGATHEEICHAALQANALEFIDVFPEKFNTVVGERGIKLSGGQRQRIAIARAVLRNPSILILDEATSSLDSESERIVQEALDKLMVGRTSIVIAHRLSTIRNADKILVIDGGKISEAGTHDELIGYENGLYQHLSKLQFETAAIS